MSGPAAEIETRSDHIELDKLDRHAVVLVRSVFSGEEVITIRTRVEMTILPQLPCA